HQIPIRSAQTASASTNTPLLSLINVCPRFSPSCTSVEIGPLFSEADDSWGISALAGEGEGLALGEGLASGEGSALATGNGADFMTAGWATLSDTFSFALLVRLFFCSELSAEGMTRS